MKLLLVTLLLAAPVMAQESNILAIKTEPHKMSTLKNG